MCLPNLLWAFVLLRWHLSQTINSYLFYLGDVSQNIRSFLFYLGDLSHNIKCISPTNWWETIVSFFLKSMSAWSTLFPVDPITA